MAYTYKGGFPNVGYFISDPKDMGNRTPFKCRIIDDAPQFFTTILGGLMDKGTNLTIITPKRFNYASGCNVIIDGILYSVLAINPYIPDNIVQGKIKRKVNAEYIIQLGG